MFIYGASMMLSKVDKGEVIVTMPEKDVSFTALLELSDYGKRIIKEGGAVNYLRNKLK